VPVSCNTLVSSCGRFEQVSLTRIGSPYVIAEFAELAKTYRCIAGFEANGGFLLGSDIELHGQPLAALPTRDAVLPALMVLAAAGAGGISTLVNALPKRFTHSDRIKDFPTAQSRAILAQGEGDPAGLLTRLGFQDVEVVRVDTTDGLRLTLQEGGIVHLRPSGNAPELRCYAEADSLAQAQAWVRQALDNLPAQALA